MSNQATQNFAKACYKCRRPCEGESFVALKDGTVFHRFCFTCDICQNELPMKFALKNGKYYHTECYAEAKAVAPKCLKCETPIISAEITILIGNDMRFHNRCFVCDSCHQPLSDRFYATNGNFYHEECVACSLCNTKLLGRNFSQLQEGGYVCDDCLYSSIRNQSGIATSNGYTPSQQEAPQQDLNYDYNNSGYQYQYVTSGPGNAYGQTQDFTGHPRDVPLQQQQSFYSAAQPQMQQQQYAYPPQAPQRSGGVRR